MVTAFAALALVAGTAASAIVKNACVCCVTDARPGGMPIWMAKKISRNCPVNSVGR
jgi:hypothetical protein